MSLKHGLLGLLNYRSMTGYELDRLFKSSLAFFWCAKTSQIYRELDAMERSGWLSSKRVVQTEKPNKRVYSITAAGKTELLQWLSPAENSGMDGSPKSPFLMRVFFAGEMGREHALGILRRFLDECVAGAHGMGAAHEAIAEYAPLANTEKIEYWKITALHGEIMHRAAIEWAQKAIAILEKKQ